MKSDQQSILDVAVGIVTRPDGQVLLGQRPPGKAYAGWWEFPGGKLETGESVHQALARELSEELGLRVTQSAPWLVREHVYEHAHVRLHFRRVTKFEGEPQSREGQEFCWCNPNDLRVEPLLPATVPLMRLLSLPQHYGISCAAQLGTDEFLNRLDTAFDNGLRLLQLREPTMPANEFDGLFEDVLERCRDADATLLVNSVHPKSFWNRADGVHWRGEELIKLKPVSNAQIREYQWAAASCHSVEDLVKAGAAGIDFAVLGPVQATASHPGAPKNGLEALYPVDWNVLDPRLRVGRNDQS